MSAVIRVLQPSSRQRRAAAKPIPPPAAAVINADLPSSKLWPGTYSGTSTVMLSSFTLLSIYHYLTSLSGGSCLTRHAQPVFGDQVELNFVGASIDGVCTRE